MQSQIRATLSHQIACDKCIRPLTLLLLRLYKRIKPLSFVLVLHGAFLRTTWLNLNRENDSIMCKFTSTYPMADHLMNYSWRVKRCCRIRPFSARAQAQTSGFILALYKCQLQTLSSLCVCDTQIGFAVCIVFPS